jgi:2',3'-cyclic-nucleotide 2'-phosphodiesterase (5'-nucleotidase family)
MKRLLPAMMVLIFGAMAAGAFAATLTNASFPLEGKAVCCQEVTLGNLVADALKSTAGTDIALVNASQIRPLDFPAGPITDDQISLALTYPDEPVARITLKGSQVQACLARGLSLLPLPNKGFLQVSGLKVKFDSRQPAGARIVSINLVNGSALDPNKTYQVAMPSSLAKGAGGYFTIINGAPVETLDTTIKQAVVTYVTAKGVGSARENTPRLEDAAPKAPTQ